MYFEMLKNTTGSVSIHMNVYSQDEKGRRIVGCSVDNTDEFKHKLNMLISELELIKDQGLVYLENR